MSAKRLKPVRGRVLLVDDPQETVEHGVTVVRSGVSWRTHLDYLVAAVADGVEGFGVGDRVVLDDANAGRSLYIDGTPYRLVEASRIVGLAD